MREQFLKMDGKKCSRKQNRNGAKKSVLVKEYVVIRFWKLLGRFFLKNISIILVLKGYMIM